MNNVPEYQPPLASYFADLENRYGSQFNFDSLNDEELLTLEKLGREAIEHDQNITAVEKANLKPLLQLIDLQRRKRGIKTGKQAS